METVQMSAEERREYEAYKAAKAEREAKEKAKRDREAYRQLVDETINSVFPDLEALSGMLASRKKEVYDRFHQALLLKAEIFEGVADNKSNTFTDKECKRRIGVDAPYDRGHAQPWCGSIPARRNMDSSPSYT